MYNSVDDIDLYIGSLYEIHVPGTLMGPTALCVITDQFKKIKNGDRFFYDIGGQSNSFTTGKKKRFLFQKVKIKL